MAVIFITTYDPFGRNRMVYTIKNSCVEEPGLPYEDGARTIFLYTKGTEGKPPEELVQLAHYMEDSTAGNAKSEGLARLHEMVTKVKADTKEAVLETIRICKDRNVLREYLSRREKEVVDIMMALFDQQKAVEQFGYEKKEEGREEGRKEGRKEGKREVALNMKAEGMADSVIARILGEGLDVVQEWLAGKPVARP